MPTVDAGSWWTPRRFAVATGAVICAAVMAGLEHDRGEGLGWRDAQFVVESAIAGGFLGNVAWLLADATRRITRLALVLSGLSLAAWLNFLVFGERHVPPRAVLSNGMGEFELVSGLPFPVAGRSMGTHGAVNRADRILNLAAGPAVFYAAYAVLTATPGRDPDDPGASYVVAGFGCLVSTAFWLAVGNGIAARRARRRARRASTPA